MNLKQNLSHCFPGWGKKDEGWRTENSLYGHGAILGVISIREGGPAQGKGRSGLFPFRRVKRKAKGAPAQGINIRWPGPLDSGGKREVK